MRISRTFLLLDSNEMSVTDILEKMNTHMRKHLSEPWFSYIQSGRKRVEGRLYKEPWISVSPGTEIEWYNEDKKCICIVDKIIQYDSFKQMLISEGLEQAFKIYRQYFSEQEESNGVVAIHLHLNESYRT